MKTKWMLVSKPQMSRYHSLGRKEIDINCNRKALERVKVTKLFGVHLDLHLDWKNMLQNYSPPATVS